MPPTLRILPFADYQRNPTKLRRTRQVVTQNNTHEVTAAASGAAWAPRFYILGQNRKYQAAISNLN
jgi:hypothetical protein